MEPVNPFEEALYEMVASEISAGQIKKGLWLKATVDSGGNEHKAKALYTQFRLAQLVDEIARDQERQAAAAEATLVAESAMLFERLREQHFGVEDMGGGRINLFAPTGDCHRFNSYAEFTEYTKRLLGIAT